MATSKERPPTYHVVPHFNFAAKDGALQLGRVYKDLLELAPMNKKPEHRIKVPDDEIYPPTTQEGFDVTRSKLATGDFGVWAKVFGLSGVGAGASAGAEKGMHEGVSCTSVVTFYFDPDDDYISKCLASKPIKDYMTGSGRNKPPVFLLTGLKVAKKLKFRTERSSKGNAELGASVSAPQAPVEVELNTNLASEKAEALSFETDDIVVGFRVAKYTQKKPSFFGKKKDEENQPVGGLYVEGAEMLDDREEKKKPLTQYEEVPIPEELKAQEAGIRECWVVPTE